MPVFAGMTVAVRLQSGTLNRDRSDRNRKPAVTILYAVLLPIVAIDPDATENEKVFSSVSR
jgi:hypothetical protein